MERRVAAFVHTAFGLAFDIEKTSERKSGFKPAAFDLGSGKELFGDIRLDGFAALLRTGFAKHLVLVGGNEGRYKDEKPAITRAFAIREMLIRDFHVNPAMVRSLPSSSNTGGNIAAIKASVFRDEVMTLENYAVVSNLYHLPRASLDLVAANLPLRTYAAEAFWLLEQDGRKDQLIERLGGGPLAERIAEESQGIADKLRGTYKPRTDASVVDTLKATEKQR